MSDDHVMLDLETADKLPTSAVLSIGAVVFKGPHAQTPFYQAVALESSLSLGLTKSESTMAWWAKQAADARAVFTDPSRMHILDALKRLHEFISKLENPKVWGNGSDFDNAILSVAYALAGYDGTPWRYKNNRCYRTAMAGVDIDYSNSVGVHHNALDDAITQADRLLQHRPESIR